MGLASLNPSTTAAASPAVPKSQPSFYLNKPSTLSAETNKAIAQHPQVVNTVRSSAEPRLIFDASDSRRGLDDWELEDFVLVATIEGSLYALDRQSGATKWVLEGGGPAVEAVGKSHSDPEPVNSTKGSWKNTEQQPRWIVQPVEGGQLFLFDSEFGVLVLPCFKRFNCVRNCP
jgi:serine/threonine-protein kinase/endoribonuclease IRE1